MMNKMKQRALKLAKLVAPDTNIATRYGHSAFPSEDLQNQPRIEMQQQEGSVKQNQEHGRQKVKFSPDKDAWAIDFPKWWVLGAGFFLIEWGSGSCRPRAYNIRAA
jgi:hypothetical protein